MVEIVGVPKECFPGERRVSLTPKFVRELKRAGLTVLVERGAGEKAGFDDAAYQERGASIIDSREDLFRRADAVLQLQCASANWEAARDDLEWAPRGQVHIGFARPFDDRQGPLQAVARSGVELYAMELIPRVSRAQSMDALSSMATIAGYKAVLLAAERLPKMFPMLVTAAGTVSPAKVLVIGAGVAGLQAIATARRLGARVRAYDIRPEAKEEVLSLGAEFVDLPMDAVDVSDEQGYARRQTEAFYEKQRQVLARAVAESDVVLTTAAVPGKPAPRLLTASMVQAMAPGSVVVDLAAESGGNCELTTPDQVVHAGRVTVLGPTNLPSSVPYDASTMYARNVSSFLLHLVAKGRPEDGGSDEILTETLVTRDGRIVHPRVLEALAPSPEGRS